MTAFEKLVDQKPHPNPKDEIQKSQTGSEGYQNAPIAGSKVVASQLWVPGERDALRLLILPVTPEVTATGLGLAMYGFSKETDDNGLVGLLAGVSAPPAIWEQSFVENAGSAGQTEWFLNAYGTIPATGLVYINGGLRSQYSGMALFSGIEGTALGAQTPSFGVQFSHWDGAALTGSSATFTHMNQQKISVNSDLVRARGIVQAGAVVLTFPGGAARTNNVAVNFPTNFASTPFVVATPFTASGVTFLTLISDIGPKSISGTTLTGITVDGSFPGAGTTVTAEWVAVGGDS